MNPRTILTLANGRNIDKRERVFHYVPHWQALDWLALGWIVVRKTGYFPNHDQYVCLMEWLCDCRMVKPQ